MKKKNNYLQSRRRTYYYTAFSKYYQWETVISAENIRAARAEGLREARRIMGNHAVILRDTVREAT